MKEISYVETKAGLFEPALTRSQRQRDKRETQRKRERREEFYALLLGIFTVICFAALGAWQGSLMVMK
jgi:hypothetical protein